MKNYDWIVIGGGITGSALSYELAKAGYKVLLLEKDSILNNATTCSYGGVAYWSGKTKFTNQLCQESMELYPNLSEELGINIEYRKINLLLTIDKETNPKNIFSTYQNFYLKPELLDTQESCTLEPLLNPEVINGSIKFNHGHINVIKLNLGYQKALQKLKGEIIIEKVINFLKKDNQFIGVKTDKNNSYFAKNTVVCTGGLTRKLLQENNLKIDIYFTHAQLIKTVPTEIKLNNLIMSAKSERLFMESEITKNENDNLWENPTSKVHYSIIETGGVQFLDGSLYLGQISEIITDTQPTIDAKVSEAKIRKRIATLLPSLSKITGTWYNCQVAFNKNSNFLVEKLHKTEGIYLFSGFTSPLVYAPTMAKHFVNSVISVN